jgi:hypothetical protein
VVSRDPAAQIRNQIFQNDSLAANLRRPSMRQQEHATRHENQSCIEACVRCAQACEHCESACLGEHDLEHMTACIHLDHDCAAICWAAAGFVSRDSRFAQDICRVCAEICDACGNECRRHKYDHCQACAEACEQCAEECRRMSGVAA